MFHHFRPRRGEGELGMAIIIRSVSHRLCFSQEIVPQNVSTYIMYGTVDKADKYYATRLEGQQWLFTDRDKRIKSLVSATERIDRLNFRGVKVDSSQPLQFPRGTDTLVPVEIEQACYQVAYALLKGIDPDTEADNLPASLLAYGNLRSQYDRSVVNAWTRAGIPNQHAWNLLLPFLDPRTELVLRRNS